MLRKVRFISSIAALYVMTIGMLGLIAVASQTLEQTVAASSRPIATKRQHASIPTVISGKPIRIVIPAIAIDLPLDEGIYDSQTGSWTLSDSHAQYAVMSEPANNHAGITFVYGHGTDAVFGKLSAAQPPNGTIAQLYTDNGHVFTYSLGDVRDHTPSDTSLFDTLSNGSPQLVVQTCTGMFSEWRTMFTFTLTKVES